MKTAVTAAVMTMATISMSSQAGAETRVPLKTTSVASVKGDKIAAPKGQATMRENVAEEWTLACYAEFGPNATHPDAALLEKCLN